MLTRRESRDAKRLRSRRIRAILAGGLVLGVGAAVTLAAWNDSEYGAATFTSGKFDIVGSTDGGTNFASHTSEAGAAALSFSAPFSAMAPGSTVYSLFIVKTANPSVAGALQLSVSSTGGTGLGSYLRYGVRTIANGAACNSSTYPGGASVVPDNSVMSTAGTGTQAVSANGANQVNYCVAVTLPTTADNGAQSKTAIQSWLITGTST